MATLETIIPVRVYGAKTTWALLNIIAALVPLVGVRASVWLANRVLHGLLWAKVGRCWIHLGKDIDVTAQEE